MTKPRDTSGNDFVAPCGWLAGLLFQAKHGRLPELNGHESKQMRDLTNDLYDVVLRHWERWGE